MRPFFVLGRTLLGAGYSLVALYHLRLRAGPNMGFAADSTAPHQQRPPLPPGQLGIAAGRAAA